MRLFVCRKRIMEVLGPSALYALLWCAGPSQFGVGCKAGIHHGCAILAPILDERDSLQL